MRRLAIGDVHGCFEALRTLMDLVTPADDDELIFLGDYVDRGPASRQVLDWLIDRQPKRRLIALRGNHEVMMLAARRSPDVEADWLSFGGRETLASYPATGAAATLRDVPPEHWTFLKSTLPWYETDSDIFVHANLEPDVPLNQQTDEWLYWEKFRDPPPHISGKRMICGHTSQKSGVPLSVGHAVCIDTWVYGDGWLTCLDVATGRYWQANEAGATRDGAV